MTASLKPKISFRTRPDLGPGLQIFQVNGYGGIDYNEIQSDPMNLAEIFQTFV